MICSGFLDIKRNISKEMARNIQRENQRKNQFSQKLLNYKLIKNNLIPKGICVNLFGYIFTQNPEKVNIQILNHEKIHTEQQKELLYVFFYIIYLIKWFIKFIKYKSWKKAYYNISFEKESYNNDNNLMYLDTRSHYNYWKI